MNRPTEEKLREAPAALHGAVSAERARCLAIAVAIGRKAVNRGDPAARGYAMAAQDIAVLIRDGK